MDTIESLLNDIAYIVLEKASILKLEVASSMPRDQFGWINHLENFHFVISKEIAVAENNVGKAKEDFPMLSAAALESLRTSMKYAVLTRLSTRLEVMRKVFKEGKALPIDSLLNVEAIMEAERVIEQCEEFSKAILGADAVTRAKYH